MIKAFSSKPQIIAEIMDFDNNSRYLNLQNGIYDFITMEFFSHDKKYMLTKKANFSYDPDADCDRFKKFIFEISDGDKGLARFIMMVVGYVFSGTLTEHCIFLLIGLTTRNGKSTLINTLTNMLGGYAVNAQPETFALQKRSGSGATPDIARLAYKRFISVAEPPEGMKLDASMIKALTGEDKIATRDLYAGHHEFEAQGVIVMHTNHLPVINDGTLFASGRIVPIPFDMHFPFDKQDNSLIKQFSEEEAKAGIFNFILKGYSNYLKKGLAEKPERIESLIKEYSRKSDPFGTFIDEKVIRSQKTSLRTNKVSSAYNRWAGKYDLPSMSNNAVTRQMKQRGYKTQRKSDGNVFVDIHLQK